MECKSRTNPLQPDIHPPNLYMLSAEQLENLSPEDFMGLYISFEDAPHGFTVEEAQELSRPILNPTGVWADYNETVRYYVKLLDLFNEGMISPSCMPPPPSIENYTDIAAPPSDWKKCPDLP